MQVIELSETEILVQRESDLVDIQPNGVWICAVDQQPRKVN